MEDLMQKRKRERKKNLYILQSMVKQNVRFKYRNSMLGVLWTVLRPILEMLVMWLVFNQLFGRDDPTYHLYLLSGLIAFNVMSEATNSSLGSIVNSAGLLKTVKLQYQVIPLAKTMSSLMNFIFSGAALLIIMIVTMIMVEGYVVSWTLVFLIIWLPSIVVFSYGLALALSALYVFFRDMQHLYAVFITLWRYLTPLFYKPESLADSWAYPFIQLNPMTQFVGFFRSMVIEGSVPTEFEILSVIGFALIAFGLGATVFKALRSKFILYI